MRASSFLVVKDFPKSFLPAYTFTNLCGLYGMLPKETAYASTFLIDQTGTVFFAENGEKPQ
jgi:hypothetical protein